MKKLAIIHYMPLEYYPPITNFLDVISKLSVHVKVWSTQNNKKRFPYKNKQITTIKRSSFPKQNDNVFKRLFNYFEFNISSFIGLLLYRPEVILYYETYSAYPVFLYLRFFGKKTKLYIHYHEYEDQKNYENGMKLVKYYHKLEKKFLYQKAIWVSQTNSDRLKMFASDHPELSPEILKIMPNYPPKTWSRNSKQINLKSQSVIKTVYVGALSLKDTFIKAYCDWVAKQKGKVHFHIYAYNLHDDTKTYLKSLKSEYIVFYPKGVEYSEMPTLLANYDIGLILYKARTNNYKYNAPNKLFEYLVCGLNVLYADVMLGVKPYESSNVKAINFKKIPSLQTIIAYFSNAGLPAVQYVAQDALEEILDELEKI